MKIVKILEEIKELDINIEEMGTIKLMNGMGSSFETYLTILSQKARDKIKLPNLPSLLSNLEDEERRMKQTTNVNLAQSKSTSSSSTSSRGGSSFAHEVAEVIVDKLTLVEEEVVVHWEAHVV